MELVFPILVTMMELPDSVKPMRVVVGVRLGFGLGMACLNLRSVLPKQTLGAGISSGVRRGGVDAGEEALEVVGAAAAADLGGDILSLSRCGRIVWGSGMVGRIGRIGAVSEDGGLLVSGGVPVGCGCARVGGLAALPLGGVDGGMTVTSSCDTSSTELSRVSIS